jgi:purine-binding chemotaxis protein CheW
MADTTKAAEQTQFLTFLLAEDLYAVSILRVREIIEYDIITRVPNMPTSIRGVINLRGAVVPVIDLAVRFGLRDSRVTKRTCVIIAEVEVSGERLVMGLMADAVSQVIDLPPADIEPPPAFGTRVRVDFLKGLGKIGKKFVLILDLDRALSATDLLSAADAQDVVPNPAGIGAQPSPAAH